MVGGKGKKEEDAVKPLKAKGSHVELVSAQTTPMHTLSEAFNRAHFSQILVSLISLLHLMQYSVHYVCAVYLMIILVLTKESISICLLHDH